MTLRSMPNKFVTAAMLATLAACGGSAADAKSGDAAAPVNMTVGPENVAVVVNERIASGPAISGSLSAEREATVRAQVAGPVLSTHAEQGSRVGAGMVLARVDDRTMRDGFLSARVRAASASANGKSSRGNSGAKKACSR